MDIRSLFKGSNQGEEYDELRIELAENETAYQVIIPMGFNAGEESDGPYVAEAEEDTIMVEAPFVVRGRELDAFIKVLSYNKIPFHVNPI